MVGGKESFEAESYVYNWQGLQGYPHISNDSFVHSCKKERRSSGDINKFSAGFSGIT